jgi:FlaA1/EpsC-like NDP-sugar epimerase
MPDTSAHATRAFDRLPLTRWWRARRPTRRAVIVAAVLALLFEMAWLAAVFVGSVVLLQTTPPTIRLRTIIVVLGLKVAVFYWRGLCHRPWRATAGSDVGRLVAASSTALVLLTAFDAVARQAPGWPPMPLSVLLLDWVFTLLIVGGVQVASRGLRRRIAPATRERERRTVHVIDASPAGKTLAAALGTMTHPDGGGYVVAGLLDDAFDRREAGAKRGVSRLWKRSPADAAPGEPPAVRGPIRDAPTWARRLRATEIVVLEGSVFGARLRSLCDACHDRGVRVKVASFTDAAATPRVRDVELADLLSRLQARLSDHDAHVHPFLHDRTVLVTGAGGSIGSEICRQLVRFEPARLLLVERSECALFAIHRELTLAHPDTAVRIEPILCDVTNAERVDRLLAEYAPQVVIHAAAFKHVPLMEAHPVEAIENNALATATLAEAADAHGVETFIALSTDKAVHPTSVMGATKLVAERFLQAFAAESPTRFTAVRFGNVIGSSGSAVPIFEEQLRRGRPITITHADVRRYFMTINEAAQLVLLAGSLPKGGTYVLEMGAPIRIVDLVGSIASVMRVPHDEVRLEFCGLRPGEKLTEELFFADERRDPTINPLVTRVTRPQRAIAEVREWLGDLKTAAADGAPAALRVLMDIVAADCGGTPGGDSVARTETDAPVAGRRV